MAILDILTEVARTSRWGPVATGADWNEVTTIFGDQCALTALPSGATFAFEIAQGAEPVLNVVGLPGDSHDCPVPPRRTTP
ncbi:hypothetical protein ACWCXX_19850 [Streptomyces sp. NPDC001732]